MIQFLKNEKEHLNKSNALFIFVIFLDLNADDVFDRKLQGKLKFISNSFSF